MSTLRVRFHSSRIRLRMKLHKTNKRRNHIQSKHKDNQITFSPFPHRKLTPLCLPIGSAPGIPQPAVGSWQGASQYAREDKEDILCGQGGRTSQCILCVTVHTILPSHSTRSRTPSRRQHAPRQTLPPEIQVYTVPECVHSYSGSGRAKRSESSGSFDSTCKTHNSRLERMGPKWALFFD
jgi:hypothetical protein